ncbi:aspartyl protease family protein [Phenylobacterium sp.]|uniref:aspartyl protease family protein n=1 Tax=Phenylobacterium sp. TaxID=1871053 RepID=UPI002DE27DD5|nr:aspartyl protease family protein [Phenylobacterium sp.]
MNGKALLSAAAFAAVMVATGAAAAAPVCNLQRIAELPVRMTGLRPSITTQVNGVDLQLLVDTGVYRTVVSRAAAERAHLQINPASVRFHLRGVGGLERDVGFSKAKDFEFAGAQLHDISLMVAGHAGGAGLDGNVGLNLLGFADVEFDLAHEVIRLYLPKDCVGGGGGAYWADPKHLNWLDIAPIDEQTQHIRAEATVNGKPIRVIFDTGASRSGLKRAAAEKLGIKLDGPGVRPGGHVRGFGPNVVDSWIVPVSVFSVGGEEIHNTQLRVFDGPSEGDHDMVIGADFFRAHRVYVSSKARRLFFTYNGSGPVFRLDEAPASEAEPETTPAAPPAQ